jgi:hypothetical protein
MATNITAPKIKCQAEDQGGWPACDLDATWQTKRGVVDPKQPEQRSYACDTHRKWSRFYREEHFEPIGE